MLARLAKKGGEDMKRALIIAIVFWALCCIAVLYAKGVIV